MLIGKHLTRCTKISIRNTNYSILKSKKPLMDMHSQVDIIE